MARNGRPRLNIDREEVLRLHATGKSWRQVALVFGCSTSAVYRIAYDESRTGTKTNTDGLTEVDEKTNALSDAVEARLRIVEAEHVKVSLELARLRYLLATLRESEEPVKPVAVMSDEARLIMQNAQKQRWRKHRKQWREVGELKTREVRVEQQAMRVNGVRTAGEIYDNLYGNGDNPESETPK